MNNLKNELKKIKEEGLFKNERLINSPQSSKILIQNNQTNILSDVVSRFNSMVNSSVSSVKVEITTSEKLNDIDLQYISQSIHSTLNTSSTINVKTDSSILGGIKLRVGNKIFDNSVSYQINQLKKTLHNM